MKKFLSILLLIALCIGAFSACNINGGGNESETEAGGLDAAAEYLRSMYKDNATVTSADYDVAGKIIIDGVSFTVTWKTDAETVTVKESAVANFYTVDVPDENPEVLEYTLTATIKDANGNTKDVTFKRSVPVLEKVTVEPEKKVVLQLIDVKDDAEVIKYVTGVHYLYTSSSGSQKWELCLTENKAEALAITIQENDNDTISFVAEGKYLYCDANNVQFVDEEGEFTEFVLETAAGGSFIKCATANYNGKAQYIEMYSGYLTCYGMNETKLNLYTVAFVDAENAAGTIDIPSVETPTEAPTTTEKETTPDETESTPLETESTPNETESTPNETESTPNETESKPAETESKPAETESKPAETEPEEKKIILQGTNSYNGVNTTMYVTGEQFIYTSSGGNSKGELTMSEDKAAALPMTVVENDDGTVSFVAEGKYLMCDANNVQFVSEQSDNTKFILEETTGGYFIKCAVANYNGKAQYLEVYSKSLTCYGMGSNTVIYTFAILDDEGSTGTITTKQ